MEKGLRAGAIGLLSSVVIAVSSTAPAYSMAATLGLVVAIVGVHSPGTLIVSFLPMLCIAYAFRELNKADPDCGTTFTWTTRAFGPWAGWMGGWGIIAADIIVMASLSQIAGRYAWRLVGADGLAAQAPSLHWLNPWTGSFSTLSNSFLLAVFVYWGWACALSVNEETRDSSRTPGRAAVMSTLMLVAVFAIVSTAALAFAGPAFLSANSTDVLSAMANAVLGTTAGKLLILCVLTSTAASTQT